MTQVSMSTKVNYEQQKGKIIININKILKYLISTNQQKQYWLFQETKDQSRKREEAPITNAKKENGHIITDATVSKNVASGYYAKF